MSSFPKKTSISGFVLLCAAFSGPLPAAEYTARFILDQSAYYDSNLPMFSDEPLSNPDQQDRQDEREKYVSAYELAPQVTLRARSQTWDFKLGTILRFSRLSDELYDSDDQLIDLDFSHFSDVVRWDVSASADRDSTRSAVEELGSILAATRTESYSFGPRWTRTISERNAVAVGGSWSKVDYDSTRFSDYEYNSVDATWLRQLNEKNQLQLSVYRSDFDSGEQPPIGLDLDIDDDGTRDIDPPVERESETVGLTVTLERSVNEAMSTNFSLGARQVDTRTRGGVICDALLAIFGQCQFNSINTVIGISDAEDDSTGFTAAAGIDYKAESWNVSASVSRSLVPNGSLGELLETDSLRLSFTRRLKQGLSFDLIAELTAEEEVDTSSFERDRVRIEPRVRWRFAERWSLVSSLRYRARDQEQQGLRGPVTSDADGTTISFRVRYEHPRAQWSR